MPDLASKSFAALGTTAVVVVDDPPCLQTAVTAVRHELADIDRTCSRFREDSDLSRLNDADGAWTDVDDLLIRAVDAALRAARLTEGLVDPTIGEAMLRIGYDRDFADVPAHGPTSIATDGWLSTPGWCGVEVRRGRSQLRLQRGVRLDLGATAKALAADRSADRAATVAGAGVLVSLGETSLSPVIHPSADGP